MIHKQVKGVTKFIFLVRTKESIRA